MILQKEPGNIIFKYGIDRTPVELQSPDKAFTDGGKPLGLTALDYWRFQFSNFWDMQEEIAEFLVAMALELELPQQKWMDTF